MESGKKKHWPYILLLLLLLNAVLFGALLGTGMAVTVNTKNTENFTEFETALPTRLLDINGELITEFASDEKRELISFDKLPQHMIDALVTREDRIFYAHHGFSPKAIIRAVIGQLTRKDMGGGSTLTQQIAGYLYCDRTDMSIRRKVVELWWAMQMERRYSKNEILELYLNRVYLGGGTYGVNAASKYYFGHSATEITPAEAALLVIQLSNPALYNPFEHTNLAMARQRDVLAAMTEAGYLTKEEADDSFDDYWANFDYTRTSASAYFIREDKAPWFSEYVRRTLSDMIYGGDDIYTSGFTVNTTLNLSHQKAADEIMQDYIAYANATYQSVMSRRQQNTFRTYVPMTSLLTLMFNLPSLRVNNQRNEILAKKAYTEQINPVIDVMSLMLGMDTLKTQVVNKGNALMQKNKEQTTIEGAMIALENDTGYIDAIVGGGAPYGPGNEYIRATQSKFQPGSTFKPLYYSAAIDSRQFTMTTTISDTPTFFQNADGTPYIPQDFKGQYRGDVQVWYALAHSLNIPSIKILDAIGFDAAINRAAALLGIPQEDWTSRALVPGYTLGLGTCSVTPLELAKAFSTFANNGKEVTPIAIRTVEDKNGNVVMNPEKDLRLAQQAKGSNIQKISPQTAFVMQEMLKKTVESGTLANGANFDSTAWTIKKRKGTGNKFTYTYNGRTFTMPAAGKTGTTQNWKDAWAVGFTPYYTAAFWFGFDQGSQSLGLQLTGSTLAGLAWGDFMHVANEGKPYKSFSSEIPVGVVQVQVCSVSGDLLTPECGSHSMTAYYLEGTQPLENCTYHSDNTRYTLGLARIKKERLMTGYTLIFGDEGQDQPLTAPTLNTYSDSLFGYENGYPYHNETPEYDDNQDDGSNWLLE